MILTLLLHGLAAQADPSLLQRLDTGEDGRGWESVGRLELGSGAFCTATLIEADLVLTAAHCLFNPDTGLRVDPENIRFLAGWRNGRAIAYSRVRHGVVHPQYDFSKQGTVENVRNDLAIVQLLQPIRKPNVQPFETGVQPIPGQVVGVVSYAKDRSEAPSLQRECDVLGRQHGALIMSCLVDFGSSGAPVFRMDDGWVRIVSVVSAKAEVDGQQVSLGAHLGKPLAEVRAHIAAQKTGPKFEKLSE